MRSFRGSVSGPGGRPLSLATLGARRRRGINSGCAPRTTLAAMPPMSKGRVESALDRGDNRSETASVGICVLVAARTSG